MDEFLKIAASTAGLIIAAPATYSCITFARHWGAVVEKLDRVADSFDKYAERNDERSAQHAERISRIEAKVDAIYTPHTRFPRLTDD